MHFFINFLGSRVGISKYFTLIPNVFLIINISVTNRSLEIFYRVACNFSVNCFVDFPDLETISNPGSRCINRFENCVKDFAKWFTFHQIFCEDKTDNFNILVKIYRNATVWRFFGTSGNSYRRWSRSVDREILMRNFAFL